MEEFRFRASVVFCLSGAGVVFRGYVRSGEARAGMRVLVITEREPIEAVISRVAVGRSIVDASVRNEEVNILLTNFSEEHVDRLVAESLQFAEESAEPDLCEVLNIKLPVEVVGLQVLGVAPGSNGRPESR